MTYRLSILFLVGVVMGLASCKNNDEVFPPVVSSFINVVNASTDTLNFYVNGTRKNNNSSLYPMGQSYYLTVPAGTQNYQFKKAGSPDVLFSLPLNLKDSLNYSLYVYGESANKTFYTIDSLRTYTAYPDTTQIRFVNVSPDAGNLTVTVNDTLNFKSRAFKTSSVFLFTDAGQKEVKVYLDGAATPKIDTTVTVQAGGIYTIFSKGLLNGKGSAVFDVGLVTNH
jgi:hypothetical protein